MSPENRPGAVGLRAKGQGAEMINKGLFVSGSLTGRQLHALCRLPFLYGRLSLFRQFRQAV